MKKKQAVDVAAPARTWLPTSACNTSPMRIACSTSSAHTAGSARCAPEGRPRCGPEGSAHTLPGVVVEFVQERLPEKLRERLAWRALSSDVALARSAYGRDERGVKHPHQYRLTEEALSNARSLALARADLFWSAPDFERLLELARVIQHEVHGLGPLWSYDFAERIGAHLEIAPTHTIYVQRGALVGATNLGLRVRNGKLRHEDLPEALRVLDAADVEDFLCIKKSRLSVTMLVTP